MPAATQGPILSTAFVWSDGSVSTSGVGLKRSWVGGAVGLTLLLAACSGSGSNGGSSESLASQSASSTQGATADPSDTASTPVTPAPFEEVLVQINVNASTLDIVTDPVRPRVWVTAGDAVVGIDTETNSPIERIKGFRLAGSIAITQDGSTGYALDLIRNEVVQLDLENAETDLRVKVGKEPSDLLLTSDGGSLLVSVAQERQIAVLNPADLAETATIALPGSPSALAEGPSGTYFVALGSQDSVVEVDLRSGEVVRTFTVQDEPTDLAVSPDGSRLYVANLDADTISVIDLESGGIERSIAVGSSPSSITISADGAYAYVTNYRGGNVDVIDTASGDVIGSIEVNYAPAYMTLSLDGTRGYVSGGDIQVLAPAQ